MALADKRDFDRAAADYDQAIKLDPKFAPSYLNRGLLWQAKKDYDRAIADFDQAIRLAPDNAAAVNARGLMLRHSRASSTAPSPISTAPSRSNPTMPTITTTAATSWRDRGRFDRAVEDYDKAIELSPSFAFAFYNRSQAHYLAGRFAEALADAGKAAALNENSAAALSLRGLIQEKLGARDAAIADLRRAAALDPGLSQAVDALRRMGVTQ